MSDQRSDIQSKTFIERIQILRDSFPRPLSAGLNRFKRNSFDVRQYPGQIVTVFLMRRRHSERAVADHDSGHTVIARVRAQRVPGDLSIIMRVVVDDAGSDNQTIRINRTFYRTAQSSDLDATPLRHSDVAVKPRQS